MTDFSKGSQTKKNKGKKDNKLDPNEYREYVDFVNELNDGVCQMGCGRRSQDVHHSRYGNYGSTKSDFSIISICRECHDKCHKEKHSFNLKAIDIGEENYEAYKESRIII